MSGNQERFQQAMNQGHSAAWDQLWDRAAAYYRQALEEFPNHPQALANLGLALFEQQQYDEALRIYIQAARLNPDDPLPVEKVAQLFERLGNVEQARQAALRAAELYLKSREVNKAIDNWMRVLRLDPEDLTARGRLALVLERTDEKLRAAEEYLAIASIYQKHGKADQAAQAMQQAVRLEPHHPPVVEAALLLRDGRPLPPPPRPRGGTAPLRLAQIRQLQPPDQSTPAEAQLDPIALAVQTALTALAEMLFDLVEESQEKAEPRRGLLSSPGGANRPADPARLQITISQVVDLQSNNRLSEAVFALAEAVGSGLSHPAAYFDLGYLYTRTGEYDRAVPLLKRSTGQADYALGSFLLLAEISQAAGNTVQAVNAYLEALRLADMGTVTPDQAESLRQIYDPIIETYQQQPDTRIQAGLCQTISDLLLKPDWRSRVQAARQQVPASTSGAPPFPLAEILVEVRSSQVIESISAIYDLANQGKLRSAMEAAFFALQHSPTYLPLHSFIGDLLLRQSQLDEAAAKYAVVARAYTVRGELRPAIELYRKIISLAPLNITAHSHLIETLVNAGQTEAAVQAYLELGEVYYRLADLANMRQTYTEALRLAQASRVDRQVRVDIMHRIADIDLQQLDWRQALRVFEQIRTLQPDDEKSRLGLISLNMRLGQANQALAELDNYLSYLKTSAGAGSELAFMKKLVDEAPDQPLLRMRLADACQRAGHSQEAIQHYDLAGKKLAASGDRVNAALAVESLLALNPPNRAEYQALLQRLKSS